MEKFMMIEQLHWHIEFQAYPFRNCTQNNNATEIGELHFLDTYLNYSIANPYLFITVDCNLAEQILKYQK